MPESQSSSPLPIAFWIERQPDGGFAVSSHPAKLRRNIGTPGNLPVLVNDLKAARESRAIPESLDPYLLDIRELFSFTHPVSPADEVPVMLGILHGDFKARTGAKALAQAWPHALERFADWHPLLAEAVIQLLSAATPAWRALAEAIASVVMLTLDASPESGAEALITKLRPSYNRLPKREVHDSSAATPLDPDFVASILGPSGRCASMVQGYEHRPGQLLMTRAVTEAFNNSKHLVVEAGTGVGKSLAYLLPSILWAQRNHLPVVVSTNTKNLQTQLFEKDIPTLRNVLDTAFSAALIKGRMNYVCLRHLQRLLERREAEIADDEAIPFAKTLVWLGATATGDLDELDRVVADSGAAGASIRSRLPCPSDECGGRRCRFASRCLLQRARALSLNADIIVANHSLVFAESDENQTVFPKYHQMVFDEAHNLEESATRYFTVEISPMEFAIPLRRLWRAGKSGGTGSFADFRVALQTASAALSADTADRLFEAVNEGIFAADKVRSAADDYFRALAGIPSVQGPTTVRYRKDDLAAPAWQAVRPALDALFEAIEKLLAKLNGILADTGSLPDPDPAAVLAPLPQFPNQTQWDEAVRALASSANSFQELQANLAFVSAGDDPDSVFWLEVFRSRPDRAGRRPLLGSLQAAPVDISQKLADNVFNARESIVLCSATLSVNGSFAFLAHRIGLDKLEEGRLMTCQAPSPFDYARQCHACVPLYLPDPSDPTYTQALSEFLVRLFRRTRGRALVLFTSYEMMRAAAQTAGPALAAAGIQLLVQGSGASRDRLTRTFRRDVSSVLFGTDSFWEGVDVMGESLSCVVLARLPFDSLGDPLIGARCDRVAAEGGSSFFGFQIPNAVIKLRQGFGRLIRHREDRGIVVIADRRIVSKGYGLHFRRNLPAPLATHRTEEELFAAAEPFLRSADAVS